MTLFWKMPSSAAINMTEQMADTYIKLGHLLSATALISLAVMLVALRFDARSEGRHVEFSKKPWAMMAFATTLSLAGTGHFLRLLPAGLPMHEIEAACHMATGIAAWFSVGMLPYMVRVVNTVPMSEARRLWHEYNVLRQKYLMTVELATKIVSGECTHARAMSLLSHLDGMPEMPRFDGQIATPEKDA